MSATTLQPTTQLITRAPKLTAEPMASPIQARTVNAAAAAYVIRLGMRPTTKATERAKQNDAVSMTMSGGHQGRGWDPPSARQDPRKIVQKAATESVEP